MLDKCLKAVAVKEIKHFRCYAMDSDSREVDVEWSLVHPVAHVVRVR